MKQVSGTPSVKRGASGRALDDHKQSAIERHGMTEMLPCTPTAEMRRNLELNGETFLSEHDLDAYSSKLNAWIEEFRFEQKLPPAHSWFNLFKEIDNDGSGFITFDELTTCVRRELKRGPRTISHTELQLLWVALDQSNDNHLDKDEMAGFFERGLASRMEVQKKRWNLAPSRKNLFSASRRMASFGRSSSSKSVAPESPSPATPKSPSKYSPATLS